MAQGRGIAQAVVLSELTLADCLDEGFALARRQLRGPSLLLWLINVVCSLALAAFIWFLVAHEGLVPGGSPYDQSRFQTISVLRLLLVAIQVVFVTDLAWSAFEDTRDGVPASLSRARARAMGLFLAPLMALGLFAPQLLCLGARLMDGRTMLLPSAWMESTAMMWHIPVLLVGLILWPTLRFAPAVMVVEGTGPLRALARSVRLTFSSRGQAHFMQGAFLLIHLALGIGFSFLMTLLGPALPSGSTQDDTLADVLLPSADSVALIGAGMLVVEALFMPQFSLSYMLSYLNTRARREGLDVVWDGYRAGLLVGKGNP